MLIKKIYYSINNYICWILLIYPYLKINNVDKKIISCIFKYCDLSFEYLFQILQFNYKYNLYNKLKIEDLLDTNIFLYKNIFLTNIAIDVNSYDDKLNLEQCINLKYCILKNNFIIREEAFANCIRLKHIIFSKKLKSINAYAFYNCISLKKLYIPKNTKYIQNHAFYNCINLEVVFIPKDIKYIGISAFENCSKLKKVYFY